MKVPCIGCGYNDRSVECSGIYYCPNPMCTATGGNWIARNLPSVKGTSRGFTVDGDELHASRLKYIASMLGSDPKLSAFLREQYPDIVAETKRVMVMFTCNHDRGDEDHEATTGS